MASSRGINILREQTASHSGLPFKMVEPMNTSFMSTYRFWAGTAIASSLFLVKVTPQNSIWHNLLWTAASVFFLEWFIYGVYVVILWPKLLSPLRHLPGPSVCPSTIIVRRSLSLGLLYLGWLILQRPFRSDCEGTIRLASTAMGQPSSQ